MEDKRRPFTHSRIRRLDFVNAVHDIRRFNYVSKIMYMLFSHDKLNQVY